MLRRTHKGGPSLVNFGLSGPQTLTAIRNGCESCLSIQQDTWQLIHGDSMLSRGSAQGKEALLLLLERARVHLDSRHQTFQFAPRLFRQSKCLFKPAFRRRRELSRLLFHPAQSLQRRRKRFLRAAFAAERVHGCRNFLTDPACVDQNCAFGSELLFLISLRRKGRQFLNRVPEIFNFGAGLLNDAAQIVRAVSCLLKLAEPHRHLFGRSLMTPKCVEQPAVRRCVEQSPVVGLPMNLHEQSSDIAKQADPNGLIIHECPRAALSSNGSPKNDLAVGRNAILRDQHASVVPERKIKHRGGGTLQGARPDVRARAGASAGCKAQRVEQDRFAGPRLAGQHIQA